MNNLRKNYENINIQDALSEDTKEKQKQNYDLTTK
jgi:hypothetical protein